MTAALGQFPHNHVTFDPYHHGQKIFCDYQTNPHASHVRHDFDEINHPLLHQSAGVKGYPGNKTYIEDSSRKEQLLDSTSERHHLVRRPYPNAPLLNDLRLQGLERNAPSYPLNGVMRNEVMRADKPVLLKKTSPIRKGSRRTNAQGFDMSCVFQNPLIVDVDVQPPSYSTSPIVHDPAIIRQKSLRSPVGPRRKRSVQISDMPTESIGTTITTTTTYSKEDFTPVRKRSINASASHSSRARASTTPVASNRSRLTREARSSTPMPFSAPRTIVQDHIISQHAGLVGSDRPATFTALPSIELTSRSSNNTPMEASDRRASDRPDSDSVLNLQGVVSEWPIFANPTAGSQQARRISEEDGEFIDIAALKKELNTVPSSIGILPIILDDPSRNRSTSEPSRTIERGVGSKSARRKQSAAARIETAPPSGTHVEHQAGSKTQGRKLSKRPKENSAQKPLPKIPTRHRRAVSSISSYFSGTFEPSKNFHVNATDVLEPKPSKSKGRWPKFTMEKEYSRSSPDLLGSYFEEEEEEADGGPHPGQKVYLPKKRLNFLIHIWKRLFGKKS